MRLKRAVILMKAPLLSVSLFLAVCALLACNRPKLTGVDFDKIDTSSDPEQVTVSPGEPIVITVKNGSFTLIPKARYKLSGRVVSTESYTDGWESILSPVDLAIVWGELAEPFYDKYISYSQGGRWYFFKVKADSPLDTAYVANHSANNHIVPVNQNVSRAVQSVSRKDRVVLEGALVNVTGVVKGKEVGWNTSFSRTDMGNGSCELFYVTKARIESKVYE